MKHRNRGLKQEQSAAKVAISIRSGRRIENAPEFPRIRVKRKGRTRKDPLAKVWENELVPLLEQDSEFTGLTLLEYLQERYPNTYDQRVLRTLQRRVKQWKALHGPDKEVFFEQKAIAGLQGFSDFTHPKDSITIQNQPFPHLLYQFRLAYSGWRSVTVVLGGESYVALIAGVQRALWQAGGSPLQHRTDSLSAARNNLQNQWSEGYIDFCAHYSMQPTRNNPGKSHENGVVECAHGSLKRRISQRLKLRGNRDFQSVEEYQKFIDQVVALLNRRTRSRFLQEKPLLQPLPETKSAEYQTKSVKVTRLSTIQVCKVIYSVPSRLIGEKVQIRLYHDKLAIYVGQQVALTLKRVYPQAGQQRARSIDYKHVIRSLVQKPQAFRYSRLREDLLPDENFKALWKLANQHMEAKQACKWIVTVLWIASEYDCEEKLSEKLLTEAKAHKFASIAEIQSRFCKLKTTIPESDIRQHPLATYDALLPSFQNLNLAVQEECR